MVRHRSTSTLLRHDKYVDEDGDLIELAIWKVPRGGATPEGVRYRLAFVLADTMKPSVLYDNHHPKGHHRHRSGGESPYLFSTVEQLIRDFLRDVQRAKAIRREERP